MNRRRRGYHAPSAARASIVAVLVLAACGSSDSPVADTTTAASPSVSDSSIGGDPGTVAADSTDSTDSTQASAETAGAPAPATAPTGDAGADACAALPSLEQIGAVMGVALASTEPLERGPGVGLCEAGGAADGVTNVQFSTLAATTREQSAAIAEELGYPVTDLADPALPGGFTYAGAAAVNIDDTEYLVQAIGLDTLGDPNSAVAVERSVQLLVIWLANLGLAPLS